MSKCVCASTRASCPSAELGSFVSGSYPTQTPTAGLPAGRNVISVAASFVTEPVVDQSTPRRGGMLGAHCVTMIVANKAASVLSKG